MKRVDTQTLGRPVNKTAALVTSRGESARFHIKDPKHRQWDAPPETAVAPPEGCENLTGVSFGRMRVVAYMAGGRGRWLVQCSCGLYEQRWPKAIKNPNNNRDACNECRTFYQRKRHAEKEKFFERHGVFPNECDSPAARAIVERHKSWP